jgi:hypothetical protein
MKALKPEAKKIFSPLSCFCQVFGDSDDKTNTLGMIATAEWLFGLATWKLLIALT